MVQRQDRLQAWPSLAQLLSGAFETNAEPEKRHASEEGSGLSLYVDRCTVKIISLVDDEGV